MDLSKDSQNFLDLSGFASLVYIKTPFNPPCLSRPKESLLRFVMPLGRIRCVYQDRSQILQTVWVIKLPGIAPVCSSSLSFCGSLKFLKTWSSSVPY